MSLVGLGSTDGRLKASNVKTNIAIVSHTIFSHIYCTNSNSMIYLIRQGVTFGGTGKETGDRHPKISEGVLIGAHATILGNITIGECVMIAAGSLVLQDVPPHR